MNALANPEVGEFLNQHFVATFRKVGTFSIIGGNKVGGNVAAYFCDANARVLHAVAGPVNADAFLREARWAVDSARNSWHEVRGSEPGFKRAIRRVHANRLENDFAYAIDWENLRELIETEFSPAFGPRIGPVQSLDNRAKVHLLLAAYPLTPIHQIHGYVFEGILGERLSKEPVQRFDPDQLRGPFLKEARKAIAIKRLQASRARRIW